MPTPAMANTGPTAEDLALAAAAGDSAALDRLLGEHYRLIYRAAYRWCGHPQNAEDIAHEACIKVARYIGSYRGESSFVTWLYRIVMNCAKDYGRKDRLTFMTEAAYIREADETIGGGQEEHAAARSIVAWLESLPAGMKETAWLVYAEGMNHREAAAILGCAETTVSWRLFQLKKLAKRMDAEEWV